ncbi:MAG: PAS domain S-box protein [bacterium]|nr:PAS domain S-box protein [bacterium]
MDDATPPTDSVKGREARNKLADIRVVRSRLVDNCLISFAVIVPLALGMSLSRVFEHGWHNIYFLHIAVTCTVISGAVLRKRLSYHTRTCLLLGLILAIGAVGLRVFGLSGGGLMALGVFSIMTAITLGKRAGLIACGIGLAIIAVTAAAVCTGAITYSLDLNEYASSLTAWITAATIFLLWFPMAVISLGVLYDHLVASLKAVHEAHARHERLADNLLGSFLYRHDAEGVFSYVSSSITQVLGYTPEEFSVHYSQTLTDHPINQHANRMTQHVLAGGEPEPYEVQVRDKDGGTHWLAVSESAVHDTHGTVVAVEGVVHDISDRKHAEQELRAREEVLGALIETSRDWIWSIDSHGVHTYCNPAVEAILGYTAGELLGKPSLDLVHDEDRQKIEAMLPTHIADKEGWSIMLIRWRHKDGGWRYLESNAVPILDESGELAGFRGVDRDVTERMRAEEELRDSEQRYHSLFEHASDAIFLLKDGHFVDCNPKTLDLFGCTRDQIVGETPYGFSPETQADGRQSTEKAIEKIQAALQGEPQTFEWQHCRRDGSLFDAEVNLNRLELGGVEHVLVIVRDITERKNAEAELRRFALVIEQAAEIVVIADTEGSITYVNPAFEEVTGYTREEAIGQNPRILKSGEMDESIYRVLWETLVRGETWSGRLVNKRKDGTLFTEDATISPLRSTSGEVVSYVAVKHNVSRELELEEQFFQAQKMEAVGQLAGGVAHDFNNLLQVIQGYGELVMMDLDAGSKMYDGLNQVMEASDRARTLVRQLLAFSRKQVLELEDVDLSGVVGNLAKMIQRVIGADISFDIHSEPGYKRIRADKGQLEQILMNLCVNARDAMPEGGALTVETGSVTLDGEFCAANDWAKPGRYVVLSVSDTGCGMDEETQRRIFEPFFTTKELGKGTGLGLSTVFGIVRQHHGMVHVYSEIGTGSAFRIYLPKLEGAETKQEEEVLAPPRGGTETVLLADDDKAVCGVAENILTRAGYTVLTAFDGEDAIRVFDEHAEEIDLALLDVVMPNLGGKAVAHHIRETCAETPVLFASGYSADAIHTGYILDEGVRLIQKPYHRIELLRRVREVLDS